MLQTIKSSVFQSAQTVGLFDAVAASAWRRNRVVILCYHGVALDREHVWNPNLYVDSALLRRRLQLLRDRRYNILPLGEAVERLYAGTLPPRSVVLTFDDGYFDFYRQALPLLREFQAPATVYVSTYYSQFQRPVFDVMVSYLLWNGAGKVLDWPEVLGEPVTPDSENRRSIVQRILQFASDSGCSARDKDNLAAGLARRLGIDYEELCSRRILQFMTADELRAVASQGIDIQLHTHRHRMPLEAHLFLKEIEDNRAALDLDGNGRKRLLHFCYPSGVYYAESGGLLKQSGVVSATTYDRGLASPSDNPFYLPRFGDSMIVPDLVFEAWVGGAANFLPRRLKKRPS